jgi:hypothetical protein
MNYWHIRLGMTVHQRPEAIASVVRLIFYPARHAFVCPNADAASDGCVVLYLLLLRQETICQDRHGHVMSMSLCSAERPESTPVMPEGVEPWHSAMAAIYIVHRHTVHTVHLYYTLTWTLRILTSACFRSLAIFSLPPVPFVLYISTLHYYVILIC